MIDIEKITEDTIRELLVQAESDKLRAEGVRLLYVRIREQAGKQNSIPASEEAGETEDKSQELPGQ
jgi:hypothetical protein